MSETVTSQRISQHQPCREHVPFVQGQGRYLDDLDLPGSAHAAFVRSPHAHARLLRVDAAAAEKLPGVLAVLTGAQIQGRIKPVRARLDKPAYQETDWPALAGAKVRYVGEAVAAVVAVDRYQAEDGAAKVQVDYDPLPVVSGAEAMMLEDAPQVHESLPNNILFHFAIGGDEEGALFEQAALRVRARFKHPRVTGLAIENCGVVAQYQREDGELTVWSSTQVPHLLRDILSECLSQPADRLRVVAPDVGGAFGVKMHAFPEELVVAYLARQLGRPIKWVQDRMENLQASTHARDDYVEAELTADSEGNLIGLRAKSICDVGAYSAFPITCALEPYTIATALPGPYRLPLFLYDGYAVATNKCPVGAYRGVGFVLGPLVMEGLMDRLARKLGMDPVELRLKNLAKPEEFPFPSPSGVVYDSGDYRALLRMALDQGDYGTLRDQQQKAQSEGRQLGIGVSCFVEPTGMGSATYRNRGMVQVPAFDSAALRVNRDGDIEAFVSTPSQGQGQITTMAQLLSRFLGLTPDTIHVHLGDTATCPYGTGTFSSRSMVSGGGALLKAAQQLRQKLIELAARHWAVDPDQVVLVGGHAIHGERELGLKALAQLAYSSARTLSDESEPGLEVRCSYDPPAACCSAATHLAVVEVDPDTNQVIVLRYVVAEDCGPMVNQQVVEGQIRGGIAQGLGIALLEDLVYDDQGQLLTTTLMDYLVPGSDDVPNIEIVHMETPSPWSVAGLKGVGESGTIGAPAAIVNAVLDAIGHHPNEVKLPLTPERIFYLKKKTVV